MKRIVLKLSGEALAGDKKTGFDLDTVKEVGSEVLSLVKSGCGVGVVIGGGNFWRGRTGNEIDRTKSDTIGMLATVMNAIYTSEVFRTLGMKTKIFTPFPCGTFTEVFSKDGAISAMNEGHVVFFAGGTGHPYFSTDTGCVLRAIEIEADAILLAKAIDGVYDKDPALYPDAVRYDKISIDDVVSGELGVVDLTASVMAKENKMPMYVFALNEKGGITNAASGKFNGTVITVED